jgi:serine/threonine protein kinase
MKNFCSLVQDNFLNDANPIRELGKGTYGSVYLVQKYSGNQYAVKYMYNDNNGITKSSLLDVDAILRLRNVPDVINAIGICYQNNHIAFILEAMDSDLFSYIHTTPVQDRLKLVNKLLNTLINVTALMETLNITHFDIKPQNILVHIPIDGNIRFKVTDFGLSKPIFGSNVIPNEELYTIWYRPPEMLSERNRASFPIFAGDIWAIALTVLEFINGSAPFQGGNVNGMIFLIYFAFRNHSISQINFELANQNGTITGNIDVKNLIDAKLINQLDLTIVNMLSRMLTLNPDQRPTGTQLMHEFNGTINPEFLTTLYPPIYPRRIYIPALEIMMKVGNNLFLSKATILIGIEIFTRYLDLLNFDLGSDSIILLRGLSSLQIAVKFAEQDLFNLSRINRSYQLICGSKCDTKQMVVVERDILNKIEFQIYNLNLSQVIERAYSKNIDLTQVSLNQFAEPLTYWLI